MPNSIITHLQNQPILADEQEKIVNDPAFKKCLSDYHIRLLYLPDVLRDISWNRVNSDLFLITAGKYLLNQIHINPIFLNPRYFHGSFKLNSHVTFAKNQIVKSDMLILIGSRTSNQISVFLYDKINKLLYLADQYNRSYF